MAKGQQNVTGTNNDHNIRHVRWFQCTINLFTQSMYAIPPTPEFLE